MWQNHRWWEVINNNNWEISTVYNMICVYHFCSMVTTISIPLLQYTSLSTVGFMFTIINLYILNVSTMTRTYHRGNRIWNVIIKLCCLAFKLYWNSQKNILYSLFAIKYLILICYQIHKSWFPCGHASSQQPIFLQVPGTAGQSVASKQVTKEHIHTHIQYLLLSRY